MADRRLAVGCQARAPERATDRCPAAEAGAPALTDQAAWDRWAALAAEADRPAALA